MADHVTEEQIDLLDIDLSKIESAVIRRLIEEVRNHDQLPRAYYDRVYNRHNRS